jgi:hypothetical protein
MRLNVLLEAQPTKEFVTSEQVAALALFLCGDDAAQSNGSHLTIDGGWTGESAPKLSILDVRNHHPFGGSDLAPMERRMGRTERRTGRTERRTGRTERP